MVGVESGRGRNPTGATPRGRCRFTMSATVFLLMPTPAVVDGRGEAVRQRERAGKPAGRSRTAGPHLAAGMGPHPARRRIPLAGWPRVSNRAAAASA